MRDALRSMEEAAAENDAKGYWNYHLSFHDIFIRASENDVLINILKTLRMHSLWYRFSYQYYKEDLGKQLQIHQEIFELLINPEADRDELGQRVQNHIEVAHEKFLAYL